MLKRVETLAGGALPVRGESWGHGAIPATRGESITKRLVGGLVGTFLAVLIGQAAYWALPRATQFSANRVAIDAVRRFRGPVPKVLDNPTEATIDAASNKLDREALDAITRLDQVKTTVYINPVASIWMKYSFGDGTIRGVDVHAIVGGRRLDREFLVSRLEKPQPALDQRS